MTELGDLPPPPLRIFEDDAFTLEQSDSCSVPGYLILRLRSPAVSLAGLSPEMARALGAVLSRATTAIEDVTGADRVYCLSFGELDRRLHFHLFPRTRSLLEEYWSATGTREEPVNGPMLFEWARATHVPGEERDISRVADVCEALRRRLAER